MVTITRIGSALGAIIEGVEFGDGVVGEADTIGAAWVEHGVVFFPGLDPTPEEHLALARALGTPEAHGDYGDDSREYDRVGGHREITVLDTAPVNRADYWHTDATFREEPPNGSVLAMRDAPPTGGDTLWLSTAAAWDRLPTPLQRMAEEITGTHGHPPMTGKAEHPAVIVHPVSGRKILYLNRAWTSGIAGMSRRESQPILDLLYDFIEQPEFTIRWSWQAGDVAAWDNRSTQHYAVCDYGDYPRLGHRIIVSGEAPTAA